MAGPGDPLEEIEVTAERAGGGDWLATTDASGRFCLDPAPAGRFFVHIDGRTATNPVDPGAYYPYVGKAWESQIGQTIDVGNVYLPLVVPGAVLAGAGVAAGIDAAREEFHAHAAHRYRNTLVMEVTPGVGAGAVGRIYKATRYAI